MNSERKPASPARKCIQSWRSTILQSLLPGRKVFRLLKRTTSSSKLGIFLFIALLGQTLFGWPPQDIAGGASSLIGQDIIGGASIVFRRPPRVRDLSGGASGFIVKHRAPHRPAEPTEIARNRPPKPTEPTEIARNKPPKPPEPGQTELEVKTPQISDEARVDAFNDQGNTLYDTGQYAKALDVYKQALSVKPQDPLTLNNLGAAYFALGQNKEAIDTFQSAVKAKPDDAESYLNLGVAYNTTEKYDEAAAALNKAIALKPDWAEALSALGDTYLSLNRYDEAAKAFQAVVKLQPNNVNAYSNLAFAYDRLSRYEDSIVALKKAVQLNPADAFAYNTGTLRLHFSRQSS